MNPHVTEMQLDLYLDEGLDAQERALVQAHLATCAACRQELEAMRPLFLALDDLAVPVLATFAQGVMSQIKEPRVSSSTLPRSLPWPILALEGAISLALLAILVGRFGALIPQVPTDWLSITVTRLTTALQNGGERLGQSITNLISGLNATTSSLSGELALNLTALQLGLVLVLATAVLLLGNGLLLRSDALYNNGVQRKASFRN